MVRLGTILIQGVILQTKKTITSALAITLSLTLGGCNLASLAGLNLDELQAAKAPVLAVDAQPVTVDDQHVTKEASIITSDSKVVSTEFRVATTYDLISRNYPGKTPDEVKALSATKFSSQAELDAFFLPENLDKPAVWYNTEGVVVGPAYWDIAANKVVPASLDGDASNDAGWKYNPAGIVPCLVNCTDGSTQTVTSVTPPPVITNSARASTVRDLANQYNAGQTDTQILANLGSGWSQERRDKLTRALANNEALVWHDAAGRVVGNVYFDPRTNSLIRPALDGDATNDAGVIAGLSDLAFGCGGEENCTDNDPNGSAVAPSLVAKHTADYAGTGTIKVDVVGSNLRDYTAPTTNTLSANFDNGTIGGKTTYQYDNAPGSENIATLLMHSGSIHGSNFEGEMSHVDEPGGSVLTENDGGYNGLFNADGTAASATGSGILKGTSATGFNWQENYTVDFSVNEK